MGYLINNLKIYILLYIPPVFLEKKLMNLKNIAGLYDVIQTDALYWQTK